MYCMTLACLRYSTVRWESCISFVASQCCRGSSLLFFLFFLALLLLLQDKTKIFMAKYFCNKLHIAFGLMLALGLALGRKFPFAF